MSAYGTTAALRREHRVGAGLAFGGIRGRYGVDDRLSFLMTDFLIVIQHISLVVATAVVSLSHTHRVMSEIDIAIVAEEFRHFRRLVKCP